MPSISRRLLWVTVLLAFVAWRSAPLFPLLFKNPPLPISYYAEGDGVDRCELIRSPDNELRNCEDAAFWDLEDKSGIVQERKLLVSCDSGRKEWNTVMGPLKNPTPHGSLWVLTYGPEMKKKELKRITFEGYPQGHDFHPLGLDISSSVNGNSSNLFVVNHGRHRTTIEQFIMRPSEPTTARWVRTITSRYLISPNSIALTSPTSFYVTNDHLMTRRLPWPLGNILPLIETFLSLPLGYMNHVSIVSDKVPGSAILHYSWPAFKIPFANGVAISRDGSQVAIASTTMARIHFYNRNASANDDLKLTHYVSVPFFPDNIRYADDGALIVAGHPFFPALSKVAAGEAETAPSWIVTIDPRTEGDPTLDKFDTDAPYSASERATAALNHDIKTLYQSDGKGFSSSSTGLADKRSGMLFVSGLYAEGVLVCSP